MRSRFLVPVLSALLLLSACGGDDGKITAAPTTVDDGSDPGSSSEFCEQLDSPEGTGEGFIDAVPEEHREAAAVLAEFAEVIGNVDGEGDMSAAMTSLADTLSEDGIIDELDALRDFATDECGDTEGTKAFAYLSDMAGIVAVEADDDYCAALEASFSDASDGATDPTGSGVLPDDDTFASLVDLAPEAHREALTLLANLDEAPTDDQQNAVLSALFGLGIYAEARCGISGAAAQMIVASAFVGMSSAMEDGETPADEPEPSTPADPSAANAALPSGSGITFEAKTVNIAGDDASATSVVVPVGWEEDDAFGLEYSPPADGTGFMFDSMEFLADCDGVCGATDWEERLRAPGGYLATMLDRDGAQEVPIDGSEGVVVTNTTDGAQAVVLRWDDSVDRYFRCDVVLDASEVDLLAAFVEACTAARPSWMAVS